MMIITIIKLVLLIMPVSFDSVVVLNFGPNNSIESDKVFVVFP